jgi:hypothetical protein
MDLIALLYLVASALVLGAIAILCLAVARSVTGRTELRAIPDGLLLQTVRRAPRLDLLLPGVIMIVASWWLTSAVAVGPGLASVFAGLAVALVAATLGAVHRTSRLVFDRGRNQLRVGRRVLCELSAIAAIGVLEESEPGPQPQRPRLYLDYRDRNGELRRHPVGEVGRQSDYVELKTRLEVFLQLAAPARTGAGEVAAGS